MTEILSIHTLSKSFGGVQAVDEVSFALNRGELLGLIGPNGAGKSTLFNCIHGQYDPDSGDVTLDGEDVTHLPPKDIWAKGVGRTFQITANFLSLTARENVQMALLSRDGKRWNMIRAARHYRVAEADDLLSDAGIAEIGDQATSTLAYGDLKRLELAVALAHHPKILLMDEPTAGMGVAERDELMQLTRDLANDHDIGVLFTEHDVEAVFKFADRVIVLHQGRLIAAGSADEITQHKEVQDVYLGTV